MGAAEKLERNPVSKHQIQHECGERAGLRGTGLPNPSRETKFLGANGDRENFIFPACSADREQEWQPYPVDPDPCYSIPGTWYVITIHSLHTLL